MATKSKRQQPVQSDSSSSSTSTTSSAPPPPTPQSFVIPEQDRIASPPFKKPSLTRELYEMKVRVELRGEKNDRILVAGDKKFMYEMPADIKELSGATYDDINNGWRFPIEHLDKIESALDAMISKFKRKSNAPRESEHMKSIERLKESFESARDASDIKTNPTHVLVAELIPKQGKNVRVKGIIEFNLKHDWTMLSNLAKKYLTIPVKYMSINDYEKLKSAMSDRNKIFVRRKHAVDNEDEQELSTATTKLSEINRAIDKMTEDTFH